MSTDSALPSSTQIFVADLEEVESLPRHATMAHLETIGQDVCIAYLEHTIHVLGETGSEFHEKLIELYLASVHETDSSKPWRVVVSLQIETDGSALLPLEMYSHR